MPQREPRLVRSHIVPLFLRAARGRPDFPALARRHGIDGNSDRRPLLVPLRVEQALPDEIAALLDEPLLGVRLAGQLDRGIFGMFEFLTRCAPTLGQAIELALTFLPLMDDTAVIRLDRRDATSWLTHRFPGEPLACGRQGNEFLVASFVNLTRQALGASWGPRRVVLAHPRPAGTHALEEHFGSASLEFGAGYNGLEIHAADLARPLASADAPLLGVLRELALERMRGHLPRSGWLGRAREELAAQLDGEVRPSLGALARGLHMSARTMQRRLAEHHTSFAGLLADVRRQRAIELLEEGRMPIAEVAFRLGYSGVTALRRALRRWAGEPPRA